MSPRKTLMMTTGFFILTAGLLVGLAQSADLKIGVVDIQRVLNESNQGKDSKKALAKDLEAVQRLVAEKQKGLQDMKDAYEKQAPMLNAEARTTKERELQNKLRDFQRWGQDKENDLKQEQLELERNISIALQKVIQKLGADEGYTIILYKNENIVFFASKAIDITDRVIKIYDAQRK